MDRIFPNTSQCLRDYCNANVLDQTPQLYRTRCIIHAVQSLQYRKKQTHPSINDVQLERASAICWRASKCRASTNIPGQVPSTSNLYCYRTTKISPVSRLPFSTSSPRVHGFILMRSRVLQFHSRSHYQYQADMKC